MGLGKGIGPVTVNIILREMRSVWLKADPAISSLALLAARDLGLAKGKGNPLDALRKAWAAEKARGYNFSDFEAALVRLGRRFSQRYLYSGHNSGTTTGWVSNTHFPKTTWRR